MGRKRTELGTNVDTMVRELISRGGTAESVHAALAMAGIRKVSMRTIGRRIAEAKGKPGGARVRPAAPDPAPRVPRELPQDDEDEPDEDELPDTPAEIPEDTTIATYDRWIAEAETMGKIAAEDANYGEWSKMGRLVVMFSEARRKARPMPKIDPNEHPDMLVAKEKGRAELHRLAEAVLR